MSEIEIACIGVDGKIHCCEPHKVTCLCGLPVSRKTVKDKDYSKRYSLLTIWLKLLILFSPLLLTKALK